MLALACDYRVMVRGKAKIGLTELNLGSTLTEGGLAMLQYCVGTANAEKIIYSGKLFTAEEALGLGLINEITEPESLAVETLRVARDFAEKEPRAFRNIKAGLRGSVAEQMRGRQNDSIREFADIWYSENTRERLEKVKIFT